MGGICSYDPIVKWEGNLARSPTKIISDRRDSPLIITKTRKKSSKLQIILQNKDPVTSYCDPSENYNIYHRSETNRNGLNLNFNNGYEFIKGEFIGKGKLGTVYSGLSLNTGEIVAIKSINLKEQLNKEKQILDINEAVKKYGDLRHKNVIKYICTQPSTNPSQIDIICEFCNGGSIKQLLEKYDSFDEKLIKLYVKQLLEGLLYIHDKSIVHRNIKNCNILIDGNGTVKLSDFVVSNILMGDDPDSILSFNTNNGIGILYI